MLMDWGRGKRGQLGTSEALHPKFDVEEGKKIVILPVRVIEELHSVP